WRLQKQHGDHFVRHAEKSDSGPYVAQRSITLRSKLPPGHYMIIPSTFAPNTDGAFMLRIFTDLEIKNYFLLIRPTHKMQSTTLL
uniref:Peptidase C2 calpain domain-containing protein n=1 Tax=Callorhinchus milii TaxID=7868 RepID=A0A4W3JJ87_CALMI